MTSPEKSSGAKAADAGEMIKVALLIAALGTVLPARSALAQMYDPNYPVCMHVFGELEGERMDCVFTSLAQCAASAVGRPATCLINPYFVRRSSRPGRS
ncbi:MAG TPA: DUF3551 domain-containing protein [Bradyrhizobium sp.]